MKKIRLKLKALELSQYLSHYKSIAISRRSRAANSTVQGPMLPNFKLIRDLMGFLVACKNGEDLIKNEGARVDTTLFIDFSDTQG